MGRGWQAADKYRLLYALISDDSVARSDSARPDSRRGGGTRSARARPAVIDSAYLRCKRTPREPSVVHLAPARGPSVVVFKRPALVRSVPDFQGRLRHVG